MTKEITRIRIEYEDGSSREATGEEAQKWGNWIDQGVGLAVAHGEEAPEIDFDEEPDNGN